jgi:hypothetical protein
MPSDARRPVGLFLAAIMCASSAASVAQAQTRRESDPRYIDANVDRVVLSPTAETHPEGTIFGSLYEIVIPQVGYAPTQRLQLSLTGFSDLAANPSYVFEVTVKANLLRTRTLRIAALSAIDVLRAVDDSAGTTESLMFGRIGGTLQYCFGDACQSSVNVSGMLVLSDKADAFFPFGAALGFIGHVAGIAKVLLEYGTLNSFSEGFPIDAIPFWYVGYGMRFSQRSWGLDVVMIRNLDITIPDTQRNGPTLGDVIGFPLLVFTYRLEQR